MSHRLHAGAALLAVAVLVWMQLSGCTPGRPTQGASGEGLCIEKAPFIMRIPAKGNLESSTITPVSAPQTSVWGLTLNHILPEGTSVKKGDIVAEFDPTELLYDLDASKSQLSALHKKIEKSKAAQRAELMALEVSLEKAKLSLAQAEAKLERMHPSLFSKNEILEAELERDMAEAHQREIEGKLVTVRASGEADVEMLRIEERKILSRIEDAEKSLESIRIVAEGDGVLIYKWSDVRIGAVMWKGANFCEIHQEDKLQVKAYVLEQDAGFLKTGQEVEVVIDAFPDQHFKGKVERIDSLAKPRSEFRVFSTGFITSVSRTTYQAMKYFETTISLLEQDPEKMKPGMPVSVSILAAEIPDVISVPLYSLFEENGQPYVYLVTGSEPQRRSVKLGTRSKACAVVLEGLEEGDRIAMRNPYFSYAEYTGGDKSTQEEPTKEEEGI